MWESIVIFVAVMLGLAGLSMLVSAAQRRLGTGEADRDSQAQKKP